MEQPPRMYFAYRVRADKLPLGFHGIDMNYVTGLFFQLPQMLLNYQRYSELVFLDVSVRKTAR